MGHPPHRRGHDRQTSALIRLDPLFACGIDAHHVVPARERHAHANDTTPPVQTGSVRSVGVQRLFPGSFAFVMATGIIAVGCDQHDLRSAAIVLFWLAAVGYVVLTVMTVLRVITFPSEVLSDLSDHATSFAFLTQVAATNVLGAAAGTVMAWWTAATVLWWVSLPLWVLWLYAGLLVEITSADKPDLGRGVDGTWFMLTVSTASIAALGALLVGRWETPLVAFLAVAALCLGTVQYVIVMTMVFMRWSLRVVVPSHPPEWIATGAMAITALAGAELVAVAGRVMLLGPLDPFVRGLTVLAWATSSFWFPLLIGLGVWRHVIKREPLSYSPALWSMVFPLGMYSVASFRVFEVLGVPDLRRVPLLALAMAAAAWLPTFVGMLRSPLRSSTGAH